MGILGYQPSVFWWSGGSLDVPSGGSEIERVWDAAECLANEDPNFPAWTEGLVLVH